MRQYTSGIKFPSYDRAMEIENVIHELGRELLRVKIFSKGKRAAKAKERKKHTNSEAR